MEFPSLVPCLYSQRTVYRVHKVLEIFLLVQNGLSKAQTHETYRDDWNTRSADVLDENSAKTAVEEDLAEEI